MEWLIYIFSTVGFLLSIYFLYVKIKTKSDNNYHPICDLNNIISCSNAAKSKFSSLFFIPNAIFGIIFYPSIFILLLVNQISIIFYLTLLASIISIILIFISIKIKTICPVCTLIYIINFLMLFVSYIKNF